MDMKTKQTEFEIFICNSYWEMDAQILFFLKN